MWTWFHLRYRHLRLRSRQWLNHHPRIDRLLEVTGCLNAREGAVARGVGVGLLVALLPLFGIQTLLIVAGCILVRGNFPAGFAVSWVNNPFTIAPLYLTYREIGERLFTLIPRSVRGITATGEELVLEVTYIGLGSLCIAIPVAILGYLLALSGERAFRHRRRVRA